MNLALWAAKTGLDAQNTRMAVIANNLANTNTTGYKAGRAAFQDLMYQNIRQVGAQSTQNTQYSTGLTLGTGVKIVATEKDYTQGSVNQTNAPLDLSVTGRGFFQITLPDGTCTRSRAGVIRVMPPPGRNELWTPSPNPETKRKSRRPAPIPTSTITFAASTRPDC